MKYSKPCLPTGNLLDRNLLDTTISLMSISFIKIGILY